MTKFTFSKGFFALMAVCMSLLAQNSWAISTTYYQETHASAVSTGNGYVYLSADNGKQDPAVFSGAQVTVNDVTYAEAVNVKGAFRSNAYNVANWFFGKFSVVPADGFKFAGWYTDADCTVKAQTPINASTGASDSWFTADDVTNGSRKFVDADLNPCYLDVLFDGSERITSTNNWTSANVSEEPNVTYYAKFVYNFGEPVWGFDVDDEGVSTLNDEMINLGVPVTFPEVVVPEGIDPMSLNVTVSASLYGIPAGNEPMPLSDDDDVDPGMGVDGPVALAEAQLHNAYIDGTGLHVYLFPEMLDTYNHYGIMINAVTIMNGEEVYAELSEELMSPEFVVVPTPVVVNLGEPAWGVEYDEEGQATLADDQINLGVLVSFPDFVLPEGVNPMNVTATVSANLYGVPSGNEPMPLSEDDDMDPGMGVDGPVVLADGQLHYASFEGGVLSVRLFPEMLEVYNHYAIDLQAVTVMNGEEVLVELPEDVYYAVDFTVVPAPVVVALGEPAWGVEYDEEGQATLADDQVNLGVFVSFPDFVLPEGVNPMNVTATVSATLVGIPEGNEPMPLMDDDDLDPGMGVDGPVVLAEGVLHNASFEGGVLSARLFAEQLEVYNHYAVVLNSVMVMDGEEVLAELPEDSYYAVDFTVVPGEVYPDFGAPVFTIEDGAALEVDDVHNLPIKLYFPEAVALDGYALQYDVMLLKKVNDEWTNVNTSLSESEIFFEDAVDATDIEAVPALFAQSLQAAAEGETYRIALMDIALLDLAESEPVLLNVYEDPTSAPGVTFTVVTANGINAINAESSDAMYNVAGQKVNVAKGLIIKNGKAYFVK